jgi:multidrug efflux pump subunit AcrA (membrane-fusion protein)
MASKKIVVVCAVIALVVVAGGIIVAAGRRNASRGAAQQLLATAVVSRAPISVTVTGTGAVALADRREIRAEVPGIVEEILVHPGSIVKKGDALMRLGNSDVVAKARQAKISYELALDQLALMLGVPASRAMSFDPSSGIPAASPISGRIISLKVGQGDHVSSGAILGTVGEDGKALLVSPLTATYAARLRPGGFRLQLGKGRRHVRVVRRHV